jgi:diguanylate cyclase (GGDEF)-like protein
MGLLQRETQRSAGIGELWGVAGLDHLKQINDAYGHQAGDAVLREVARRLLASVRHYDYVPLRRGRVPDRAGECSASDLIATAERMGACVSRKPVETDAGPIHVTLSIGLVAGHPVGALLKGEELLRASATALYYAKRNGGNAWSAPWTQGRPARLAPAQPNSNRRHVGGLVLARKCHSHERNQALVL